MTIAHAAGGTQIICSANQRPGFPECDERTGGARNACATTYEYACPTGANSQSLAAAMPSQKTGFGANAVLTGTETQCTSGQLLTLTINGAGGVEPNPDINPTNATGAAGQLVPNVTFNVDNDATHPFPQFPRGGGTVAAPNFGGDNYRWADNAAVLIERAPGLTRWWDNTDQGKDTQAEVASWSYKFVSWVKGSSAAQPSCACGFDITVDWPANADPVTTYTQDAAYSSNCHF
ncbi:hypothetical protein [Afifella sp. IM 167]|uniref:hypothetical protein n=1 Tax=Afifella sp. IM 167 TaxID=2033586 RepID=UPI001CCCA9E9|nr:hypothetical protein [Afifella sp. IM 167]MBZ8133335.1 hypothetical protein [Afifella sp. IM 167]